MEQWPSLQKEVATLLFIFTAISVLNLKVLALFSKSGYKFRSKKPIRNHNLSLH